MKLLLLTAGRNLELAGTVETALRHVVGLEVTCRNALWDDAGALAALFQSELRLSRPNLLLACLPESPVRPAEAILWAARNQGWEGPLVVALESIEPQQIESLFKLGAADFVAAPFRRDELVPRLRRWHRSQATDAMLSRLKEEYGLQQFVGSSARLAEVVQSIPKFARCAASVLLSGETGTGKEMCARAIHQLGPRCGQPFVPVNCGAIPSELVENELFGHEAGAFTGASSTTCGVLHDAERGTLFLDEIDSLPSPTQVKFLRFLQDREYRPLGARTIRRADVRIIAASNSDLEAAVRSGRFRPDLFYRLNILPVRLPALRERREDIPPLARHFVAKYAREYSIQIKELSPTAMEKLLVYDWPGNVRELENTLARALVLSEQPVMTHEDICLPKPGAPAEDGSFKTLKARVVAEFEAAYLRRLLSAHEWNISQAARTAKKNRRAFWQLMRKHRIAGPSSVIAP